MSSSNTTIITDPSISNSENAPTTVVQELSFDAIGVFYKIPCDVFFIVLSNLDVRGLCRIAQVLINENTTNNRS